MGEKPVAAKIFITALTVNDQAKAAAFYTQVLGFDIKHDEPAGPYRYLTLTSPQGAQGVELSLEPDAHPASRAYMKALMVDGIPATAFQVDDLTAEVARIKALGGAFRGEIAGTEAYRFALLDDTCGNLIQLIEIF